MPKNKPGDVADRRPLMHTLLLGQAAIAALAILAMVGGFLSATTACYSLGALCVLLVATTLWHSRQVEKRWRKEQEHFETKLLESQSEAKAQRQSSEQKMQRLTIALEMAREQAVDLHQFKSDFLGHISHEIRTPLNAVVGMAELLTRTGLSKEQTELVSIISSSGETLLSVINDILNYSKIESGEFTLELTEFEPYDLVEGTAQLLADQARLRELSLTTFIAPTLSRSYYGDAPRLRQVLVNLLGNALRFAQKGEILMSATEEPNNEGSVRFEVKDPSSEMSNSVIVSLFTPLTEVDMITARKYGGTGLGLSVSKKLVELMAGKMGVETSEGGTIFWFSIPLQAATDSDDSAPELITAQNKILLVGRASTAVAVIMTYCKSWGLDCSYQPSGQGAMIELSAQPDAYQAVIVESGSADMSMAEFLSQLFNNEELSGIHSIVLSQDDATDQEIKKLGVSLQIMRKPFKKAQLREALRQCQLSLRRTGEIVRPESQLKSYIASIDFATRICPSEPSAEGRLSRLLVVEDNPVNRRLVHLQLKNLGLECDIVGNGLEALEALDRGQYDLIFMDCWMPILDGFAATAKIRESESASHKHTTIVAMTANAMESDREECLAAGMDDYISKPVTQNALKGIIDKWVSQKRSMSFDP